MEDFKYRIDQVVYNQKNQRKGWILQRNKVADNNYYLVKMEDSGQKIWLPERDLDNKSLKDKLFNDAFGFATGGVIAESPISNAKINDLSIDPNQTIKFKSLTGMEAVDRIIYLNETIKGLEEDLRIVKTSTGRFILHKEINKLNEEHDRIAKQLNYLRITYQEVE